MAPSPPESGPSRWQMLIRRLDPHIVGGRAEDCSGEFRGGTHVGQHALAELIGDQAWREAVHDYIACDDAAEMIRSVLRLVRPMAAAQEFLRLWREGTGSERGSAIELLRVTAYPQMLALVPEFLADPDEGVQAWGAGVADQLVWDEMVEPEQAEPCLRLMESHPAQHIRELAAFVREYVAARADPAGGIGG